MPEIDDLVDDVILSKPEASPFVERLLKDESDEQNNEEPVGNGDDAPKSSETSTFVGTENVHESGSGVDSNVFDPTIHVVDEFGKPKFNKDGSYRRKRGRKSAVHPDTIKVDAQRINTEAQAGAAAVVTVQLIIMCGHLLGGDEWDAREEEIVMMQGAWKDYYIVTGATAVPPWAGVVIATGAYALPKCRKPKTHATLTRIGRVIWNGSSRLYTYIHSRF